MYKVKDTGENMKNFDFNGKKYKEASAHQKEWGTKLISELKLDGKEQILDLGCGDGVLTEKLAQHVSKGKVLGIDSSLDMIKTAKELKRTNLTFEVMDINDINFKNEFDLIFSNAALHWVKDHKRLIKNCFEALKENGILRINFAGAGNCPHFLKIIHEVMNDSKYKKYFVDFEWPWYMPTVEEYQAIMSAVRFKEVKVWIENADRFFASADEMTKWIDQPSLVPLLEPIYEKDKKYFRDTVVQKMIEVTIQEDGRCFEAFRRINVYAQK